MTSDSDQDRPPPRERFAGTEHVFDLRGIATGLRHETNPVHHGHRQMTIFHKHLLTLSDIIHRLDQSAVRHDVGIN